MDRLSTDELEEHTHDVSAEEGRRRRSSSKGKKPRSKGGKSGRGKGGGDQEFKGVTWIALTRHLVFALLVLVAAGAGFWWRADVAAWLGWSVVPIGVWSAAFSYVLIARTGWFVRKWLAVSTSSLVVLGAVGILGVFDAPLGSAMGSTMGGRLAEFVVREPFTWDRYNVSLWLQIQAWARVGVLFGIGLLGQVPSGYGTGARLTGIASLIVMSAVITGVTGIGSFIGGLFRNRGGSSDEPVAAEDSSESPSPVVASVASHNMMPESIGSDLPDGHPLHGVAHPELSDAAAAFKGHATEEINYSGVRRDGNGTSSGLGSSYQSSKERVVFGMGQTLVSKPDESVVSSDSVQLDPPPFRGVSEVLSEESSSDGLGLGQVADESAEVLDAGGVDVDADVLDALVGDDTGDDGDSDLEDTLTGDDVYERMRDEILAGVDGIGSDSNAPGDGELSEESAMAFDDVSGLGADEDVASSESEGFAGFELEDEDPSLAASRLEEALIDFPWRLPPGDSLQEAPTGGVTAAEIEATSELIEESLAQHGVDVSVDQIRVGPTVTMYGLKPGWKGGGPQSKTAAQRVRVDTILNREKDIALALKCPNIRFESVVPGASVVGIEVPNADPTPVNLRSVMDTDQWREFVDDAALPVPLGMGSGGDPVMADFATMPHTLVAGATGSGKSVCINTIVTGLLLCRNPMQVRMVMIDPKRVELTPYQGIPHLYSPVVVEPNRALAVLKALTREMMERFAKLESAGVKNISHFNSRSQVKMPYLLIIVDELADLMLTSGNEVEQVLVRLAQLGRATGVHLVVATQRPSVDVVTGLIKANFPSRISFSVMSQVDSRTILDSNGADKLLGKGDMLYKPINLSSPMRVQGAFLAEEEIEAVVDFWKDGGSPPLPQLEVDFESEESGGGMPAFGGGGVSDAEADLLRQASQLAQGQKTLSTSYLQRKLKIGYPRAARLMDDLEDAGVVGPGEPGKPRKVLQATV